MPPRCCGTSWAPGKACMGGGNPSAGWAAAVIYAVHCSSGRKPGGHPPRSEAPRWCSRLPAGSSVHLVPLCCGLGTEIPLARSGRCLGCALSLRRRRERRRS